MPNDEKRPATLWGFVIHRVHGRLQDHCGALGAISEANIDYSRADFFQL